MAMKVKEVAELVGISVRTLHHYDEIGLLTPDKESESGYRLYSDEHLEQLQQILFFRELEFPLKRIKEIMSNPYFERLEALQLHRSMLLSKRKRIDQMLRTIDKSIQHAKGEIAMTNKEKFAGFDFSNNPYEQEARKRWGDEAVDQSNKQIAAMSKDERQRLSDEMNEVYRKLAGLRHLKPYDKEAQEAIAEWYQLLNRMGSYTLEAFKGLGQMYVDDERFTNTIDQFGEGLARFMSEAMSVYAEQNQS
ncbi:MerR family transcriptional regulator [Paenibacillus senegalensis]|uniref:MerR family transcriptional regulator n=1 Tax=Paenibacillus senegalensis TaxID=1465766 RepID=UPI000287CC5C|nr:MerR family transcriptional regulator [Paenibacillus senegalensis]